MSVIEAPAVRDPLEDIPVLPEEPVTRRDVLLEAYRVMDRRGWMRGALGYENSPVCILGAVDEAAKVFGVKGKGRYWDAYEDGPDILGCPDTSGFDWNDHRCKSKEQCLAALMDLANGKTWADATRSH